MERSAPELRRIICVVLKRYFSDRMWHGSGIFDGKLAVKWIFVFC